MFNICLTFIDDKINEIAQKAPICKPRFGSTH